jgi:hypothetical protein
MTRARLESNEVRSAGLFGPNGGHDMKLARLLFVAPLALAMPFTAIDSAAAKGCIKGAIVGGVAGKIAGHGAAGAAAGCAIGHHKANKDEARQQNDNNQPQQQNR